MKKAVHSGDGLSRREREILNILFASAAAGGVTVQQVRDRMEAAPTANAVRALLHILEEKGHVRRRKAGRENVYAPVQARGRAGLRALQQVLEVFYDGSLEDALAAHLSKRKEELSPDDFNRIRTLIDEASTREPPAGPGGGRGESNVKKKPK